MFPGGKKKSAHILQPLSIVEVMSFSRPESDFPRISSVNSLYVFQDLPFNPIKSGLAFFLAELMYNLFTSGEEDERLFNFLKNEVQFIDHTTDLANYPPWLMMKLTVYLGCNPETKPNEAPFYLDLEEGTIGNKRPYQHQYVAGNSVHYMRDFLELEKPMALALDIPKQERKQLLNDVLVYYSYRLDKFKIPKSLEVLETIFS